jgi:hypothetical protein
MIQISALKIDAIFRRDCLCEFFLISMRGLYSKHRGEIGEARFHRCEWGGYYRIRDSSGRLTVNLP